MDKTTMDGPVFDVQLLSGKKGGRMLPRPLAMKPPSAGRCHEE